MAEDTAARAGADQDLEARIRADIARTRRGTIAVLVVGIILTIVVFSVLSSLNARLKPFSEPKAVFETLAGFAQDHVPKLMSKMGDNLRDNAPEYVSQLADAATEQIPVLRKRAEEQTAVLLGRLLDQLEANMDTIISTLLEGLDKEKLQAAIDAAAEGHPRDLEETFRQQLEEDVGQTADDILEKKVYPRLNEVEERLQRLARPNSELASYEISDKEMVSSVLIFIDDVASGKVQRKGVTLESK